jgi:predicted O-methyltransferase YrrM
MSIKTTIESLTLLRGIVESGVKTFHHHYHILYDIANSISKKEINYVEIGCYAGGSACLMLQRKNTNVISIDLGEPIDEQVAINNINNNNENENKFNYIKGNSQILETQEELQQIMSDYKSQEIDVLFIDGDHGFTSIHNDFNLYEDLVSIGGYIIFDDYNDDIYSPEVRGAVDSIISNLKNYEIIGTIENILEAHPTYINKGNCFVIKKINK